MVKEMNRLMHEPVDEAELSRARDALMLSLPRAFETSAGVASRLATVEAYGLPHDWWERFAGQVAAVTPAEVTRIARAHFDPERLVQVVVGGGMGAQD
jgi:zinc protease